jgi:hypothetical protein
VMNQVDLGLTSVGRFDSADSIISINNTNQKPGASHSLPFFSTQELSVLSLSGGGAIQRPRRQV